MHTHRQTHIHPYGCVHTYTDTQVECAYHGSGSTRKSRYGLELADTLQSSLKASVPIAGNVSRVQRRNCPLRNPTKKMAKQK
jgi:hypothetical protein